MRLLRHKKKTRMAKIVNTEEISVKQKKLNTKVRSIATSLSRSYKAWKRLKEKNIPETAITKEDIEANTVLRQESPAAISRRNSLFDTSTWPDTTKKYTKVDDAVEFDDSTIIIKQPSDQNEQDAKASDESVSDVDDDDEDFSMEAVQKWTRVLFKKESRWKKGMRKLKNKKSVDLTEPQQVDSIGLASADQNNENVKTVTPEAQQEVQNGEIVDSIAKQLEDDMEFVKEEIDLGHDKHHKHLQARLNRKKSKTSVKGTRNGG